MIDPLARLPRTRGIVFFFQKFLNIVIILDSWDVSFLSFSLISRSYRGGRRKKKKRKNKVIEYSEFWNFSIKFFRNIRDSGIKSRNLSHLSSSEWRRRVQSLNVALTMNLFSNLFFSRPRWWKSLATRRLLGACLFSFFFYVQRRWRR